MNKVIKLQSLELTKRKQSELESARAEAKRVVEKYLLPKLDSSKTNIDLQKVTYHNIRKTSFLPSQVLLNLIRSSFHLKKKEKDKRNLQRMTLDYNLPRASKMFYVRKTLCFAVTIKPRHRIVVPIKMNASVDRLKQHMENGWELKQVSVTADNCILANLAKKSEKKAYRNHLGVDINANNVSVTALTPEGKILKQLYLGKNLWKRKSKILKRKSKLRSYADKGSPKAKERLRKLKKKVRNITKNAVGETAKELHEIAEKYECKIVFERLRKFQVKKGKGGKGRKFNRTVSLLPWKMLQVQSETRSADTGIKIDYVDPYHTSKWCPRCGSVNQAHDSKNYAIYRCGVCGLAVNSDRKASLAIAVKKFVERKLRNHVQQPVFFQFSTNGVRVNALVRGNEDMASTKGAVALDAVSDPKGGVSAS